MPTAMLSRQQSKLVPPGPPPRRKMCTDIPCCAVFLCMLAGLSWVAYMSLQEPSNLRRVLHGVDSQGDLCGVDNSGGPLVVNVTINRPNLFMYLWPFGERPEQRTIEVRRGGRDLTSRPFLYFTFPTASLGGVASAAVCVSECPSPPLAQGSGSSRRGGNNASAADDPGQYVCTGRYYGSPADRAAAACAAPGGGGGVVDAGDIEEGSSGQPPLSCGDEAPPPTSFFSRAGEAELSRCADPLRECDVCFPQYRTVRVVNYCLPDPQHAFETFSSVVTAIGAIGASVDGRMTTQELDDMRSFVSSAPHLIYEDLSVSKPVIFGCIGCAFFFGLLWLLLIRLFAGVMVWFTVLSISAGCAVGAYYLWITQSDMRRSPRYGSADTLFTQQADLIFYSFFAVSGVGALYTAVVLCVHRKIFVAVKVMKEASRAVSANLSTLVMPVVTLSLSVAIVGAGGLVALLLLSTCELVIAHPGFGQVYVPPITWGYFALLLFGCVWLLCFARHLQHAAVAGALSAWYYAPEKLSERGGSRTCLGAVARALCQHTGSIAFGSLLITLLQLARLLVTVVMARLKACAGDSQLAKLACCCVACCLSCVERCVRYLSRSSYVVMMVRGTSFCSSATEAVALLARNIIKVGVLRTVGWGFLVVGKVFIAAGAASSGALLLLTTPPFTEELFSVVPAVVAIALGSWIVGTGFMSVYNMAVDTIFICYALDLERVKLGQPMPTAHQTLSKLVDEAEREAKEHEDASPPLVARRQTKRGLFGLGNSRKAPKVTEVSAGRLDESSAAVASTSTRSIEMASQSSAIDLADDLFASLSFEKGNGGGRGPGRRGGGRV